MDTETFITFIDSVKPHLEMATIVVLGIVGGLSTIFALYVGFRLARAEDEGKRREAKQQLLWSIMATIVVATMFVLLTTLLNPDTGVFKGAGITISNPEGDIVIEEAVKIVAVVDRAINALLSLFSIGAMLFALYLGVRLAMAEDEGKRKEAKAQVFWTVIAVIVALSLSVIISQVMIQIANNI